ncbi:hypothetical protein SAMN04488542_1496 [Fontibacillus panacisegetis]|uniref:Uncharacterized protein n=1 Tax=Fontibacillus panacisegetis TaxID=670482 RepID=A0A1G7UP94_9BACL|nr:hypothetical protein [Fontibacillus panacisegetis]SDG49344.1 hypothetical protein SAMN04488542_1496 [Fontibacillus panacisegetis]
MFFPHQVRKDKDQELLGKWKRYLTEVFSFHLVTHGIVDFVNDSKRISEAEAASLVEIFNQADLAWIGTRHHEPMLFHFAITWIDQALGKAKLTYYIDIFLDQLPFRLGQILEILSISGINELHIPFIAPEMDDNYRVIYLTDGTSIISIRSS